MVKKRLAAFLACLLIIQTFAFPSSAIGLSTVTCSAGSTTVTEDDATGSFVDPLLTLSTGVDVDGAKVFITTNFSSAEDALTFTNANGITGAYDATKGILTLSGTASPATYQAALRSVRFKSTGTGTRTIVVSLGNKLAYDGHYYEYVDNGGNITWTAAKAAAAGRSFYGQSGYLAVITSQAENDFLLSKIAADAWIGASDAGTEKTWVWDVATAPEAGQTFWIATDDLGTGSVQNALYARWNTGEPNNAGGTEDYAIMYSTGGNNGKWNDLPDAGNINGYLCEYNAAAGASSTKTIQLVVPVGISGLTSPLTHTAKQAAIKAAESAVIADAGSFSNGNITFAVTGATAADVLALPDTGAPSTANGVVSVNGGIVYLGDGTNAIQVGSVSAVNNGTAGKTLEINFSTPLTNGDFETSPGDVSPSGWTINTAMVSLGALATKTQGRQDLTASGTNPYLNISPAGGYSFTSDRNYAVNGEGQIRAANAMNYNKAMVTEGINHALRLYSSGSIANPGNVLPYGSIFGPEAISSSFTAKAGDSIAFDWKAANGGDDYEVYGFIEKLDGGGAVTDTIEIMYGRGLNQAWNTSNAIIAANGTYRFRFVCGTYDNSGGLAVGASLYIDNIRLFTSNVTNSVVQAVARMVTYQNTDTVPQEERTLTVSVTNKAAQTASGSLNINVSAPPAATATPAPTPPPVIVIVNGEEQNAGTATTGTVNGTQTTTVVVDQQKIQQKLDAGGTGSEIVIPVPAGAPAAIGELNGQLVRNMELQDAVLKVQTSNATYTLPADEIDIGPIAAALGATGNLEGIKVQIRIAEPSAAMTQVVAAATTGAGLAIMVPAVDFTVNCVYGGKTVPVEHFDAYVERMVAIPDGVDPNRITTGIVVNPDGTIRHVPTRVIILNGRYYAVLNSLTNSTYSIIWNPLTFTDAETHWAKTEVNDMGSRLVIEGISDSFFQPDKVITRAAFTKALVKALGLVPGMGTVSFTDVSGHADLAYIQTAAHYGLIQGHGKNDFKPDEPITRAQAAVMLEAAFKLTKEYRSVGPIETFYALKPFTDASLVPLWADNELANIVRIGVITGKNGSRLAPSDALTRAEAAATIRRLLQKTGLI